MQNNIVKAFRQRLIRAGFVNISIYNRYDGSYSVYCSRDGIDYKRDLSLLQMECLPKVVWFD